MTAARRTDPVEVVVVGAGSRGSIYAGYALASPRDMKVAAVVDSRPDRANRLAAVHGVPERRVFPTVGDLLGSGRDAAPNVAINATPDRAHVETTVELIEAGFDVMVEKPLAVTTRGLVALDRLLVEHPGAVTRVCHVLRYAPFYVRMLEVVRSGVLGDVVTIDHRESIAYWHFAHSYVRGNWARASDSSPLVLAKCSHDVDLLLLWLEEPFASVSSSGSLRHFTADNAPQGAAPRCDDSCAAAPTCDFDARPFYGVDGDFWPANTIDAPPTAGDRLAVLATSPYGRCVYAAGNDVVDHQAAVFETVSGRTATLTISGHGSSDYRETVIDGVGGSLRAWFPGSVRGGPERPAQITVAERGRAETVITVPSTDGDSYGHGGGDMRLVADFIAAVRGRDSLGGATLRSALASQFAALAAETARATGDRVDVGEFTRAAYRAAAAGDCSPAPRGAAAGEDFARAACGATTPETFQ